MKILWLFVGITGCFFAFDVFATDWGARCRELGYTLTDNSKCWGKFFTCPMDAGRFKCDETAKVGDIKYSSKLCDADTGWLLANGNAVSRTKYAKLYSLITTNFGAGDGSTTFNLPNYQGMFLRGMGCYKTNICSGTFYKMQNQSLKEHNHSFTLKTYGTTSQRNGNTAGTAGQTFVTSGTPNISYSGGLFTCPNSVGLYVCIYAGI